MPLDRFSTTQTGEDFNLSPSALDTAIVIEQAEAEAKGQPCINHAPVIALYKESGYWSLVQGCCNDWLCPRCGIIRAKREYGRILEGVRKIVGEGYDLQFMTITCRGKELSVREADERYMEWTNVYFTALRTEAKRRGAHWCYVQITERQERGHAHSHVITTYRPTDAREFKPGQFLPTRAGDIRVAQRRAKKGQLWSAYLIERAVSAGLGREVDITRIQSPEAVAVYLCKYMFKTATKTPFPDGWRRLRYARSFPQLPEQEVIGFPVVTSADWRRVATLDKPVITREREVLNRALDNFTLNVAYRTSREGAYQTD